MATCYELKEQNQAFELNISNCMNQLDNSVADNRHLEEVATKYAHDLEAIQAELEEVNSRNAELQLSAEILERNNEELKDQVVNLREELSQKELELSIDASQAHVVQNTSVSVAEGVQVQLDTLRSTVDKLRSDRNAADNIRKTLEGEVNRLNDQLQLRHGSGRSVGDKSVPTIEDTTASRVSTLEMDKVLNKTDTVLKEVCLYLGPSFESKVFDNKGHSGTMLESDLFSRMENTSLHLNKLRVCMKDGTEADQLFESKYLTLQAEFVTMTNQYKEMKKKLKSGRESTNAVGSAELHQIILELEKALMDRTKELERVKVQYSSSIKGSASSRSSEELEKAVCAQEIQLQSLNNEIHSRNASIVLYKDQIDTTRQRIHQLNDDVNRKDSTISDLEQENSILNEEMSKLKYSLTTVKEQLHGEQMQRVKDHALHQKLKQGHNNLLVQLQESSSNVESGGAVQDEIHRLRLVLADKEGQLRDVAEEKQVLDSEYRALQLQRTANYDITSEKCASKLRRECKEAQQSIAQAVVQIREVVLLMVALEKRQKPLQKRDKQGIGEGMANPSAGDMGEFDVDVFVTDQKLGYVLGVHHLSLIHI